MEKNTLKIPENTKTILPSQYAGQNITEIIFPESAEEIGEGAFADCTELTRLWVPKTIKRIGAKAFWGCGKLRRVFIPDSVESIGHDAFDYRSCEIFCEAPSRPSGWYRDYYEELQGDMIVLLYESWCGYDVEDSCPEWASGSITTVAEPRSLRWNAKEDEVRAIWEQEEWVLERSTAERSNSSIQHIREWKRQAEENALARLGEKIESAKRRWMEASAPYGDSKTAYPEDIQPAALDYIRALEELKRHHVGNRDIFKDYEAGWEIFRVYCELAPRFEDACFRKGLDDMKRELERLVYYGAGTGGGSAKEEERIQSAYDAVWK